MENLPDLPLNLKAAGAAAELVGDQRDGGPPVGPPEGLGRAVGPLLWGLLFGVCFLLTTRELRSPM